MLNIQKMQPGENRFYEKAYGMILRFKEGYGGSVQTLQGKLTAKSYPGQLWSLDTCFEHPSPLVGFYFYLEPAKDQFLRWLAPNDWLRGNTFRPYWPHSMVDCLNLATNQRMVIWKNPTRWAGLGMHLPVFPHDRAVIAESLEETFEAVRDWCQLLGAQHVWGTVTEAYRLRVTLPAHTEEDNPAEQGIVLNPVALVATLIQPA